MFLQGETLYKKIPACREHAQLLEEPAYRRHSGWKEISLQLVLFQTNSHSLGNFAKPLSYRLKVSNIGFWSGKQ